MTPFEARLSNLLEAPILGLGYELVRVQLRGDQRKTLQIMVERQDRRGMTLNDCELISQTIGTILDVHDPIKERYALEVSSPGIDRPLIKLADFERYVGFEAKIDLRDLIQNRRHLNGVLMGVTADTVQIKLADEVVFSAPFEAIHRAKLVLTDALIEAHLAEQKKYETLNQTPVSVDADINQEV